MDRIRPLLSAMVLAATVMLAADASDRAQAAGPFDPKGRSHVPIGIVNTVDTLKTFVEAEGNFSPGFATYGIYFWLYDPAVRQLTAPTADGARCAWGLGGTGHLIPWSRWQAGTIGVATEVCQVECDSPAGRIQVVAARAHLVNTGPQPQSVALCVALRPLGAAGGPIHKLTVSETHDALMVDDHPALVAAQPADAAGVTATDEIAAAASSGNLPTDQAAVSISGDCSGALRFDLRLPPGQSKTLRFICPVLPGRRAVGHDWDGASEWAQLDLAEPNPPQSGALQPDPGLDYYRGLGADTLFEEAHAYWRRLVSRVTLRLPDPRWAECFAAVIGHAAMALNENAPDVAVVNYNVFNRDGVYVANILQKSGNLELAAAALDYFLAHPFNGRTQVEADNPGQVLWALGEHWRFSHDRPWLGRTYPAAAKIAAMVRHYRTAPGPHYVKADSLEFGERLPPDRPEERPAQRRQVLRPGSCDGHHPEYTEAFDVAGLRAAARLAEAAGRPEDAAQWQELADGLMQRYDRQFGGRLPQGYGDYSVLWPCRLYPLDAGPARAQFAGNHATEPGGWRYFALARAHQGLLAGNRDAGHGTIGNHLDHPQMRGWYAFDEGGRSGSGGWRFARTTFPGSVAMPHGWAIAEMWLLLRDSLVFEDGDRLHLLAGVPPEWFTRKDGMSVADLPTYFGKCSLVYRPTDRGATLTLSGDAVPPGGYVLSLPKALRVRATTDGGEMPRLDSGGYRLPPRAKRVQLEWPVSDATRPKAP
ncbi:MAG: hypothetical protein JXB62_04940 [Pirellulales bacterium]|nr:hypothetical protein [Pirellulales bacterium]